MLHCFSLKLEYRVGFKIRFKIGVKSGNSAYSAFSVFFALVVNFVEQSPVQFPHTDYRCSFLGLNFSVRMEFERFVGCCQASASKTFEPTKAKREGKSAVSYSNPLKTCHHGKQWREGVKVKSSSCLAASPTWIARPMLRQPSEKRLRLVGPLCVLYNSSNTLFRISWDLRQLSLSECVTHFLLRFWPSAQFAIAPKPFKVEVWALVFSEILWSCNRWGSSRGTGAAWRWSSATTTPGSSLLLQRVARAQMCRVGNFFGGLIRSAFFQVKSMCPALVSLCWRHKETLSSVLRSCYRR